MSLASQTARKLSWKAKRKMVMATLKGAAYSLRSSGLLMYAEVVEDATRLLDANWEALKDP